MDSSQRERIRQRDAGRCGYCGVHEDNVGALLTIDHHRPRLHGGSDDDENLVYCCPKCNEHKASYWHETDPPDVRLLHPLHDYLGEHVLEEESGQLADRTPLGRFFIQRLRLNRPQLAAYRQNRRVEQRLRDDMDTLRQRIGELQRRITKLNTALAFTSDEIERESQ